MFVHKVVCGCCVDGTIKFKDYRTACVSRKHAKKCLAVEEKKYKFLSFTCCLLCHI